MIGQRFGRLEIVSYSHKTNKGHYWLCLCDCGVRKLVRYDHLRKRKTKSCGCLYRTQAGLSKTREWAIWSKMEMRCYRIENDNYRYYGGVGTTICTRWRESFQAFLEDMGKAPTAKHSIDRVNTRGHYSCGKCDDCKARGLTANCRWATKAEQVRNQKSNRWYTHDGKTLILKDWARLVGMKYLSLWQRLDRGMSFADAITLPLRKWPQSSKS